MPRPWLLSEIPVLQFQNTIQKYCSNETAVNEQYATAQKIIYLSDHPNSSSPRLVGNALDTRKLLLAPNLPGVEHP
jgi:hypothetical protein